MTRPVPNGNIFVTWKQLVVSSASVVGSMLALTFFIISSHAAQPHAGALSQSAFDRAIADRVTASADIRTTMAELRKELGAARTEINSLHAMLIKLARD
jgi:septal ring factor EnvC (AmiA/AmiB activator)